MRHFAALLCFTLVCGATQLDATPLDDASIFVSDDTKSDSISMDPQSDDDWPTSFMTGPDTSLSSSWSLSLGLSSDGSAPIFNDDSSDITTYQSDNLDRTFLDEEPPGQTIAAADGCLSPVVPVNRIRRRGEGDQCSDSVHPNPIYHEFSLDDARNEEIKDNWCYSQPWLGFGNIPVARFTGSMLFPVPPDSLPDLLILPSIAGFYNVLDGALRKSIPSTSSV